MIEVGLNVLSLFDGISCGQVALERAGIEIDTYYASEIDKNAIMITQKNHPNTIQLGDINNYKEWDLPKIDIIIGGSPCQGFSFAGKQLNFEDERSKLFFKFVECLEHFKSKYFLLENVKMKKEYETKINEILGIEPMGINSNLVSAQNRKRLYWFGKLNGNNKYEPIVIYQPYDKNILLKDVVHEYRNEEFDLSKYIVPFDDSLKILDSEVKKNKIGYFRKDSAANRVYSIHNKAVTLCGEAGGGAAKMGQYLFGCITPNRIDKRQNGQRFNDGNKFYTLTAQDKHGILIDGYIRKLSPIECERLQTLPDNYTEGITEPQRYKCLGNGWTVDVITHILSNIKNEIGIAYDN